MKTYFLFFFGILVLLACGNSGKKTSESTESNEKKANIASENPTSSNEITGQWKRTEVGEDGNKNRTLENAEIIKDTGPGTFDTLNFYKDNKCRILGMDTEIPGSYKIKNANGKKMLFIYPDDSEKTDEDAYQFEIVSHEPNKLVLIPPIYAFMLIVYTREN